MSKPGCHLYAELILKGSDSKVVKIKKFKSKSFVKGFLQYFLAQNYLLKTITITDTSNIARIRAPSNVNAPSSLAALAGITIRGSVVGTGDTAVTINDYALQTLITHGTTTGKLQYGAETFGAPTISGTDCYFTATRNFSNASGGSITVNEIGLYTYCLLDTLARYVCIARDIVAGGIAVADGQTLTLNYQIKISL